MDGKKSVWSSIKGYKFNRLLLKNFGFVFVLVTLPLLVVLSLNYNSFTNVMDNRVMDMNEELLQKNAVVTDNLMSGLLDALDKLTRLNPVIAAVQSEKIDETYYQDVMNAVDLIGAQTASGNMISAAYIYSDVNDMLIDSSGAKHIDQVWDRGKWYDIHKENPVYYPYILVNHSNSIFICQTVWSMKGKPSGLFVLEVELEKLRNMLENQERDREGIFFIVDISGQTIYCNEESFGQWDEKTKTEYQRDIAKVTAGTSQIIEDHNNRIISTTSSAHKSWKYAFVTQMPDYKEEMGVVRGFLVTSVIVGIITSIIVAYLITMVTYRPMRKIMNVINNPQLHWNEQEATKEANELLYITSNIMAEMPNNEEITEETSQELEERIRALRQAQFRALQFQIDPHFLYNTLETIKWNAVEEMGLGNKTSKMLTKVARLYRLGLENDDVIVPLSNELEFLKLYIEIVKIRFGDAITFHWDIDEKLCDCSIIKMCLQPIVENAIQHGLRPNQYLGNITVSAYYQEECLYVSVENDGHGMSQTEMNILNQKLRTGAGFEESKVGLRNVNERIKLIYGGRYGVTVNGTESTVRVVLSFPCRNFNRSEETK